MNENKTSADAQTNVQPSDRIRLELEQRRRDLFPGNDQIAEATFVGEDFPLGQACDLSGEGTCEACQ